MLYTVCIAEKLNMSLNYMIGDLIIPHIPHKTTLQNTKLLE